MKRLHRLPEEKVAGFIYRLKSFPGVFLETGYLDRENRTSFLFWRPQKILTYSLGQDVREFFDQIEIMLKQGHWVAGYFTYEFGYIFEGCLAPLLHKKRLDFPLAWLGVFKKPLIISHAKLKVPNQDLGRKRPFMLNNSYFNMNTPEYTKSISRIKTYLSKGDTYQVNFTLKYKSKFSGDLLGLYSQLRKSQPTSYSGFINDTKRYILSFSPELFFRVNNRSITVRPMKGTYKRGRTLKEDTINERFLAQDAKSRAENIMIVDLLRNDLGKISRKGSVRTESYFDVERYPSLLQMTSTVRGSLRKDTPLYDIFKAIFPSGSVTGAPKIRTMQIIDELEKEPRDVYTGAIGFIGPNHQACFNVAIRTAVVTKGSLEFGVGGGIIYDSSPGKEYNECLLKANFLTARQKEFSLIETILWHKGNFKLPRLHLSRLKSSCRFFDIILDEARLKRDLQMISKGFIYDKKYRIRILVDKKGDWTISYSALKEIKDTIRIKLSRQKIDSNDPFLYHKTTQRHFYDSQRKKALKEGFFEVIFTNQKNQLTEGAISNIFLLKDGRLFTPPLSCGLLAGVLRQELLIKNRAQEKILYVQDLFKADKVFVGNSVSGLIEVKPWNIKVEDLKNGVKINTK